MLKYILNKIFLTESLKSAKEFAIKTKLPTDIFDQLNIIDTTQTKKLIHQMLRWFVADPKILNDSNDLKKKIDTFVKFSGGRIKDSIEKFKTFEEFSTFITPFLDIESKSEKKDALSGQYKKIFENENMLVVIPFTHKASCIYGAHTKWCTTARTAEHFNRYQEEGFSIYYVMNKISKKQNDEFHKMAVVISKNGAVNSCFNVQDNDEKNRILAWIKEHGITDISSVFKPILDDPMYLKIALDKYKLFKTIDITGDNYSMISKLFNGKNSNEIFPILEKITINLWNERQAKKLPKIPLSVKHIHIWGNYPRVNDFATINDPNRNIKVSVTIHSATMSVFKNAKNVKFNVTLAGSSDNFNGNRNVFEQLLDSIHVSTINAREVWGEGAAVLALAKEIIASNKLKSKEVVTKKKIVRKKGPEAGK